MLIGLMGRSGSGKTTVSLLFKELNPNFFVVDVDKIGHKAYTDKTVKDKMLKYFGSGIFNQDSSINRKKLADIVFNNSNMMQKLYDALIKKHDYIILDYALLPLTKYYDMCDIKILVVSSYSSRCKRVTIRDDISPNKYAERDSNSVDYSSYSFDYVIENNYDVNNLRKVIGDIYEKDIVSWKL